MAVYPSNLPHTVWRSTSFGWLSISCQLVSRTNPKFCYFEGEGEAPFTMHSKYHLVVLVRKMEETFCLNAKKVIWGSHKHLIKGSPSIGCFRISYQRRIQLGTTHPLNVSNINEANNKSLLEEKGLNHWVQMMECSWVNLNRNPLNRNPLQHSDYKLLPYPIFLCPLKTDFAPLEKEASTSCFEVSSELSGDWSLTFPPVASEEGS